MDLNEKYRIKFADVLTMPWKPATCPNTRSDSCSHLWHMALIPSVLVGI